jgi:hypothetical protein
MLLNDNGGSTELFAASFHNTVGFFSATGMFSFFPMPRPFSTSESLKKLQHYNRTQNEQAGTISN